MLTIWCLPFQCNDTATTARCILSLDFQELVGYEVHQRHAPDFCIVHKTDNSLESRISSQNYILECRFL